jgi:phospholipid/cholesterol/gamma-HCH transport system substrate-binding protein
MRRQGRRIVFGVASLLALSLGLDACGLSLQSLPKPGGVSGPIYQVDAVFGNVLNLPLQARVLIGANDVGQVSSITTSDYKAHVVLTIRRGVQLRAGTTAQILFDSPLGDEFIELHPPGGTHHGAVLSQGATLPEVDTSSAPSIADTLAALGALLNGGGLNQLQTIIVQLNDALDGHQGQVRAILADITTTVTSLNANLPHVDSALTGLAKLSGELAQGSAAIATGIDTIGPAVGVLVNENTDFSQLLSSTNQLANVATSIVDASGQSGVSLVEHLDSVVNQLVGVEQQLGPTLSDFAKFEKLTEKIAPGDYLQLSLTGTAIVESTTILGGSAETSRESTPPESDSPPAANSNKQSISDLLGGALP